MIPAFSSFWKRGIAFLLLSSLTYIILCYFTPREAFLQVISLYLALFLLFFGFYYSVKNRENILFAATLGIFFRALLLFSVPNLSDDYFRFLWDGKLLSEGINPFLFKPLEVENPIDHCYSENMWRVVSSKNFYSVYPPVLQFIFYFATSIFPGYLAGGLGIFKLVILLAETGSIFLIYRLLQHFNMPTKQVLLYALNPLVIIELTGNIHFEAVMIFFILASILLVVKGKLILAGIAFGLAITTKLWPLMLLVFFIRRLGWRNFMIFSSVALATVVILFLPFNIPKVYLNILESTQLYFRHFEFNAGIYYLLRWIGFQFSGYNQIDLIGKLLAIFTLFGIVSLAIFERQAHLQNIFTAFLLAFTFYFLLSTTINPWYITPLVCFSVFTRFHFAYVWSFMIPLSYITFITVEYKEQLWLVAIEYLAVFIVLFLDLFYQKKTWDSEKQVLASERL